MKHLQLFSPKATVQVGFSYKSKIGGRALHHQERGYLHQATNSLSEQLYSCFGGEQLKWARTAANASAKKQAEHCIIKRRDIYTKLRAHKVNSCFGREQLQMLHMGQNSCKSFSYKSKISIGGRALHHQEKGNLHQATNSQLQKPEQLHITLASAMHVRASYSASSLYNLWYSAVRNVRFVGTCI